jgi:predicted nucleic acid-binding protein
MKSVIDCSVCVAWLHEDETTPEIAALFNRVVESGATVPQHWFLEIANSLTVSVRRKRITADQRAAYLDSLFELDITTDGQTIDHAWLATVQLADIYGLTVYDAAYLELAQRRRVPLATLDKPLADAARKAGVEVLP